MLHNSPWFLLAASLSVAMASVGSTQIASNRTSQQTSDAEVKKLIAGIADKDSSLAEKSAKRLVEIGLPALEALYLAEQAADAQTREEAAKLVKAIRDANHLPTRVNGLEFRLIVDKEWAAPAADAITPIKLELKVTNVRKEACQISLRRVVTLLMRDQKGDVIKKGAGGGNAAVNLKDAYPTIAPNQSVITSFPTRLIGDKQRKDRFTLLYTDKLWQGTWSFEGFSRATYKLSLVYENGTEKSKTTGDPLWVGKAETLVETIVIK